MNGRRDEELGEQEEGVKQAARGQLIARFLKIKCFIEVEVELIYNVVLISTAQQSDLVMHTYIYIYIYAFSVILFSIMFYYRILNIVPCAIQ